MKAMEHDVAARAVMSKWENELQNHNCEKMTVLDVECLLHWYGVWKGEKMSKSKQVGRLVITLASKGAPPTIEEWTADNEARLLRLQETESLWTILQLGGKGFYFSSRRSLQASPCRMSSGIIVWK